MAKAIDLTGRVFGRLSVTCKTKERRNKKVVWNCVCSCGAITKVVSGSLLGGVSLSCGCLKAEQTRERFSTHGKSKTPTYHVWQAMKDRCYNNSNKNFIDYGGRGIDVCKEWIESFTAFDVDMGVRPSSCHSIERINNNIGYSKNNCKWATAKEQSTNKRIGKNNTSGTKGVNLDLVSGKWLARIGFNGNRIRLGLFNSKKDAVSARVLAELKYWSV